MKIVQFEVGGAPRFGVVDGEEVIDIHQLNETLPTDFGEFLRCFDGDIQTIAKLAKQAPARSRRPMQGLRYALPVARTSKIICLGLNYLNHLKEGMLRDTSPQHPSIFMRLFSSLVPHEQPVVRPVTSIQLDYEAELVAVVGRRARDMTLSNALSCIAGYTCGNEGTVRDFQRHTTQWGIGKNFDQTGSIGPWIVTEEELPRGGAGLKIESRLNGRTMQSDTTANMMFPLAETIVYLTKGITLEPGDLIFTGTPGGVGSAQKPAPVWMKNGDNLEVEIEGIGILRNPVIDEVPANASATLSMVGG
jgi:2-keto-4-pentenoate hydratase/2-oxohepta-3-ene-1,7-dioic acid hydratase in catechol pathway